MAEFYNIKPRELWCPNCKVIVINDKPSPPCEKCGSQLLTVIRDFDGKLVTGNR